MTDTECDNFYKSVFSSNFRDHGMTRNYMFSAQSANYAHIVRFVDIWVVWYWSIYYFVSNHLTGSG